MAFYSYKCKKCDRSFTILVNLQHKDRNEKRAGELHCPQCFSTQESGDFMRVYNQEVVRVVEGEDLKRIAAEKNLKEFVEEKKKEIKQEKVKK